MAVKVQQFLMTIHIAVLDDTWKADIEIVKTELEITEPSKTGQPTHVIQIQDLKRLEKTGYWLSNYVTG